MRYWVIGYRVQCVPCFKFVSVKKRINYWLTLDRKSVSLGNEVKWHTFRCKRLYDKLKDLLWLGVLVKPNLTCITGALGAKRGERGILHRLDYQPLFGKMSPHSSPERAFLFFSFRGGSKTGPGRRRKSSLHFTLRPLNRRVSYQVSYSRAA